MYKVVSPTEREEFLAFWQGQKEAIRGRVSKDVLGFIDLYTSPSGVGYEFGQLRPGRLGQWDLFWMLAGPQSQNVCTENEAMIACGLTATEVAEAERQEYYRGHDVDPYNPLDVACFDRITRMSPVELDAEIERLEKQLGPELFPSQ